MHRPMQTVIHTRGGKNDAGKPVEVTTHYEFPKPITLTDVKTLCEVYEYTPELFDHVLKIEEINYPVIQKRGLDNGD